MKFKQFQVAPSGNLFALDSWGQLWLGVYNDAGDLKALKWQRIRSPDEETAADFPALVREFFDDTKHIEQAGEYWRRAYRLRKAAGLEAGNEVIKGATVL